MKQELLGNDGVLTVYRIFIASGKLFLLRDLWSLGMSAGTLLSKILLSFPLLDQSGHMWD